MSMIQSSPVLSEDVVYSNLCILESFKLGEKPKTDVKSGKITKEDRIILVSFRRTVWGGCDTSVIEKTFENARLMISNTAQEYETTKETLQKNNKVYQIFQKYSSALTGVYTIANTYREGSKSDTAKELEQIANDSQRKFSVLPDLEKFTRKKPQQQHDKEPLATLLTLQKQVTPKVESKVEVEEDEPDTNEKGNLKLEEPELLATSKSSQEGENDTLEQSTSLRHRRINSEEEITLAKEFVKLEMNDTITSQQMTNEYTPYDRSINSIEYTPHDRSINSIQEEKMELEAEENQGDCLQRAFTSLLRFFTPYHV